MKRKYNFICPLSGNKSPKKKKCLVLALGGAQAHIPASIKEQVITLKSLGINTLGGDGDKTTAYSDKFYSKIFEHIEPRTVTSGVGSAIQQGILNMFQQMQKEQYNHAADQYTANEAAGKNSLAALLKSFE